jgi:tRNA modification GTPase
MDEETIVALATPLGPGGIALIRFSGSRSQEILGRIVRPLPAAPRARHSYHGFLHDGERRIDECLAVLFRAPRSYSGEDMAEISLHANPFLVEEALALACRLGARPALPGEFTYRAFRNGKMDLLQAEAVNDLVRAGSRAGSRLEFGNLEGRLSRAVAALRDLLLRAAVEVEAGIEFAEDQHLAAAGDAGAALAAAATTLEAVLASARFSEVLSRGLRVVIAGRVNVGKSSLFNALLLRERSIISELPGTTRDYIEETLLLDGFAFRLSDVAGIRADGGDAVEALGMRLSRERIAASDAALFVLDASQPLQAEDREVDRLLAGKPRLLLANKCDLAGDEVVAGVRAAFPGEALHLVSARQGTNLDAVTDFLRGLLRGIPDAAAATALNLRQRSLLERLGERIAQARRLLATAPPASELAAEEIRQGLGLIGELTGAIGAEDILRGVFAGFCIGK